MSNDLNAINEPIRKDILVAARKALRYVKEEQFAEKSQLQTFIKNYLDLAYDKYSSNLLSETAQTPMQIEAVLPTYEEEEKLVDARIIMRDNFDALLAKHPEVLIFGEDAGYIGDVNQGLEGLQEKFGELRVSDTGIREATILGQGLNGHERSAPNC